MKAVIWLIGGLLLLGTAGCEVESGYGGAYGAYGEYPAYGEGYAYYPPPVYTAPVYPDYGWNEQEYWEHHRHGGEEMEHHDWR